MTPLHRLDTTRLPALPKSTDRGFVYVVKRGEAYKIGFSRRSVARRTRDAGGILILTIPVNQQPSVLEYLINNRFADKRLPSQGTKPGDKREWFALTDTDLAWLQGLSYYQTHP